MLELKKPVPIGRWVYCPHCVCYGRDCKKVDPKDRRKPCSAYQPKKSG